ncbi:MAG: hypothetical protein WD431_06205 [Cyclobacteriaceae bacterium]
MSQYLSTIAARSSVNHNPDLLPSPPEFNATESAIEEESINPNRSESNEPGTFVQPSYFSKYIERVEADDKETPLMNSAQAAFKYEIVKPLQPSALEKADPDYENKPLFPDKTISKISPLPKEFEKLNAENTGEKFTVAGSANETISVIRPTLNPPVKEEVEKGNQFPQNNLRIERITPVTPDIDHRGQIHHKNVNQPTPKLVIGKIIVEILSPVKAPAEKIIQRVVQAPAKDNFSKTNKLMFGLGQL